MRRRCAGARRRYAEALRRYAGALRRYAGAPRRYAGGLRGSAGGRQRWALEAESDLSPSEMPSSHDSAGILVLPLPRSQRWSARSRKTISRSTSVRLPSSARRLTKQEPPGGARKGLAERVRREYHNPVISKLGLLPELRGGRPLNHSLSNFRTFVLMGRSAPGKCA